MTVELCTRAIRTYLPFSIFSGAAGADSWHETDKVNQGKNKMDRRRSASAAFSWRSVAFSNRVAAEVMLKARRNAEKI